MMRWVPSLETHELMKSAGVSQRVERSAGALQNVLGLL